MPMIEPVNRIRYYIVPFMELFYCMNKRSVI
nr:MAG TPA: hypothetical protein [Caudoviricetes sp.]